MKTPSTFLYDLVKSLSKSEKRYIKIQSGSTDKDYMQLMEALIAQKTFDEAKLFKDYEGANFLKHLTVSKRYLYEYILKSLTNFGQKSLENKIFEKISAANVLIEKGMLLAAFSELKKGQKIAETYELFELQIRLSGIEKKLLSLRHFKTKKDHDIHRIFEREVYCLEQLQNTNEYWYISQKVSQFQIQFQKIQNPEQQEHFEKLTQSPKFHALSLATNFKSKLYYFQANATYQFMLGNVKKAYEINSQFLSLLEEKSHFMKLYSERYLATLNNMLIDSLVIGNYDILEEGINRLSTSIKRPEFKSIKNIESRVFRQRYLLLINWSLGQQDFKKAMDWIPEIEKGLDYFGKKIERHHRVTFYYLVAYLLFQNNHYEEALKWNNLILNDPKEDVVKEIFFFARIFNLLIQYELDNFKLLESLLLSTPKYLKSRRDIYKTEKALFRFLRKVLNSINRKEKQKIINAFKIEIQALSKIPSEKRVFNYLDLRLWINK